MVDILFLQPIKKPAISGPVGVNFLSRRKLDNAWRVACVIDQSNLGWMLSWLCELIPQKRVIAYLSLIAYPDTGRCAQNCSHPHLPFIVLMPDTG